MGETPRSFSLAAIWPGAMFSMANQMKISLAYLIRSAMLDGLRRSTSFSSLGGRFRLPSNRSVRPSG